MARLCAKVAIKGLGRGKKRLQHKIVDLFLDIPLFQTDEVFTVNVHETHTHKYYVALNTHCFSLKQRCIMVDKIMYKPCEIYQH